MEQFDFLGGTPSLDFVNTVSERPELGELFTGEISDKLSDLAALIGWSRRRKTVSPTTLRELEGWAEQHRAAADRLLREARALRELLFKIFQAVSLDQTPKAEAIQELNGIVGALPPPVLERRDGKFTEVRTRPELDGRSLLDPIVIDAARLLTSPDLEQVRICQGQHCGWLFLDTSKNHSRRWCDMKDCGNREKARRFYAKKSGG